MVLKLQVGVFYINFYIYIVIKFLHFVVM
jgi:hypothetical protein